MKSKLYVALIVFIFCGTVQADFNPTPFPLEKSQEFETGSWIAVRGSYRLLIAPSSDDSGSERLMVTILSGRRPLASGILVSLGNQYCGIMKVSRKLSVDLCIWRNGQNLYTNIRKDSPWMPFEIFSKQTYR